MERLHYAHLGVTILLLILVIAILLILTGLIDSPREKTPAQTIAPTNTSKMNASTMKARLVVIRGAKVNMMYPLYDGKNLIGRADQQPVDIDLEIQESSDRIWSSRQHAIIWVESDTFAVEDLKSSNGTFLNEKRVSAGKKVPARMGDVIQIGEVHLKIVPAEGK